MRCRSELEHRRARQGFPAGMLRAGPALEQRGAATWPVIFSVRELRNFLLIFLGGLVTLIAIDRIWFEGQYFGVAQQEFRFDISAARRR